MEDVDVAATVAQVVPLGESGAIDALEALLVASGVSLNAFEVAHQFTPGLYTREFRAKAGTIVTSKIHRTQHPYVVLQGEVSVWQEATGWVRIVAPHHGITEPGTRRVLFCHTDIVWMTFHATELTDVNAIEAKIIEPHDHLRPLPPGELAGMLASLTGDIA